MAKNRNFLAAVKPQFHAMAKEHSGLVAAVLVGGLGTRLRPLTYRVPKPLVKVRGTPFISYVLSKLSSLKVKKCVLLTGYKHGMVKRYCKDGKKWGMEITYSMEREPLGTGGALLNAFPNPSQTILVMNGDSWVDLDLEKFLFFHREKKALASIFAMEGDLSARGAISCSKSGRVRRFLEKQKGGFGAFNTGAYLFEPAAINFLHALASRGKLPSAFSMEKDGFPALAGKNGLYAYVGQGHFLDMGTFESLSRAGGFLRIATGAKKGGKSAIFLDRDGVINRQRHDYVKHPDEFEFEEKAFAGMRGISRLNAPIFIVTNQSMVNRGVASRRMLSKIHEKMLAAFRRHGIKIREIFICPHRPDQGCPCRKPRIGMLVSAQDRFGIDLSKSFMIGDSTGDILMGNTAGCTTILLRTGHAGKDMKFQALPHFTCRNLHEAAKALKKEIARRKRL